MPFARFVSFNYLSKIYFGPRRRQESKILLVGTTVCKMSDKIIDWSKKEYKAPRCNLAETTHNVDDIYQIEDMLRKTMENAEQQLAAMRENATSRLLALTGTIVGVGLLTCYGTKIVLQWLKEGKLVINKISQLGPMDPMTKSRCGPPDIVGKDLDLIFDPTILFELNKQQPNELCREKQQIYEPCNQHLGTQYNITTWKVIGLMFGARRCVPRKTLEVLKKLQVCARPAKSKKCCSAATRMMRDLLGLYLVRYRPRAQSSGWKYMENGNLAPLCRVGNSVSFAFLVAAAVAGKRGATHPAGLVVVGRKIGSPGCVLVLTSSCIIIALEKPRPTSQLLASRSHAEAEVDDHPTRMEISCG
ncbi:hypothetical protein ANN_07882 [Periplaneta americana]|uniref:Uncharacterized protein n=1 Tax=Periplaneta americana TaxID=6978 RepID=A0ABQ8SZX0_PERAM|nr:hypothetical protein ANN_07882 [Periplaneta americana]